MDKQYTILHRHVGQDNWRASKSTSLLVAKHQAEQDYESDSLIAEVIIVNCNTIALMAQVIAAEKAAQEN